MTSVEAHVAPEKHEQLRRAFGEKILNPPPVLKQILLVQSSSEPTLWRTVGFWPNRVVFEGYRNSGDVSAAFNIFRSVGAEPTVHVFEVVDGQEWR
jgi:hypothetical protein